MQAFPVICQSHLGVAPWMDPLSARLPGLQPVAEGEWLHRDDAFAGQMAYRDRLLTERRADVVAELPEIGESERDLLAAVLAHITTDAGYRRDGDTIVRPDGVAVSIKAERPLVTAARLVQEDMLVLEKGASAHLLTLGVLCFPASWSLQQKVGRGMAGIHAPVERIDAQMNQRIERVLNALQPGNAVWRANVLCYNDPNLFQPRLESEKRPFDPDKPLWVRVERQSLRRLTPSNAIVFTIHTWLTPIERLTPEQAAGLPATVRAGGSMGEPLHP
jgi:dimethylamine monooxygenase subunit A